ncbi:hypothetical protein [Butyrivibrio sp. XPD2006]|uniref:hypothetical protein n=1 Tax=Butyrivibrio sp. XPD2006 TaxID=1280668 RepID=UPI0003B3BED0|nr:hypothetical protein [Butyrivibrio sp. XPD2006]
MDSRVFRMAILTIISAFILVLVIVYATNTDKINSLFGVKEKPQPVASEAATEEVSEEPVIYGDQIGDSLSGFLLDDDFFDETEKIPSVVVIKKSEASTDESSADSSFAEEEDRPGTGMAVVGELTNPNLEAGTDSSGLLTSLPDAPDGGYGQYIPSDQTISGTPVGQP